MRYVKFLNERRSQVGRALRRILLLDHTGCPKKYRCFINNRTKVFCSILKTFPRLNNVYLNLDFLTNIVEIS